MTLVTHMVLDAVLSPDEAADLLERVDPENVTSDAYVSGSSTSGLAGKHNRQLSPEASQAAGAFVVARLMENEAFQHIALPRHVQAPLISRYEKGMSYPEHVDDALMAGRRTDLALTLFLSDPDSYGGGELVIDCGGAARTARLPAGSAIVYPASTLHRVAPVTFGARVAAVTWIESFVPDVERRAILFDLACAIGELERTPYANRLRRCRANLLREWAQT